LLNLVRKWDDTINPPTGPAIGTASGAGTFWHAVFDSDLEAQAAIKNYIVVSSRDVPRVRWAAYLDSGYLMVGDPRIDILQVGLVLPTQNAARYAAGSFATNAALGEFSSGFDIDIWEPIPDTLFGYEKYSVRNWDGYDADPITAETLAAARSLMRMLPSTFGPPDVAPGADGTIGLEWIISSGPLKKLFIDVGPGKVWSGYWRRANGVKQSLRPTPITPLTQVALQKLFNELNV
jgi:hypothetical protein